MKRAAILCVRIGAVVAVVLSSASLVGGTVQVAHAQASSCQKISTYLEDRKALVARINKLGKRPNPKAACSLFGSLVSNGSATLKWLESNKDWCQIPDQFIQGFKADNAKAVQIRGQACKAATQQATMEKRAREVQRQQQQQSQSPMLGGSAGDPVTGQIRIPQGAL
ncbi:hypothetical protein FHS82_000322 [Pseudochelatococcus lubricantis]|uniref:Uncharacterized protein n=1 Tax=Pseudochelatococcus lubricantis TaxID=1538102 RepID=A0ABX0UU74_9HYPH|nr:hypothetical protein [Pseudochelatococcus lubricantis]NIJ56509.1 hypothetical protein [Pseudochelatococcus lubricantis]